MDLPTYTNIWRIEKRLYKLYDLRLPTPLPIVWIGVFAGVLAPWAFLLWLVGLPFATPWHVVYLVPPGIVTWLSTRPVIENKRLTELMQSQLRYMGEPRAWTRMAPATEPEAVTFSGRVWRVLPPRAKVQKKARHTQRKHAAAPATASARAVRPAVAAAAAAATSAPVAPPTRWGAAAPPRRGAAPVLPADGQLRTVDTPAEEHRPAASPPPAGSPPATGTPPARTKPERRDESAVPGHDLPAVSWGSRSAPEGEKSVAPGKPIDAEALRRLRRLAATADTPPAAEATTSDPALPPGLTAPDTSLPSLPEGPGTVPSLSETAGTAAPSGSAGSDARSRSEVSGTEVPSGSAGLDARSRFEASGTAVPSEGQGMAVPSGPQGSDGALSPGPGASGVGLPRQPEASAQADGPQAQDDARSQHRKGQPPRQGAPLSLPGGQRTWPPSVTDAKNLPPVRPAASAGPGFLGISASKADDFFPVAPVPGAKPAGPTPEGPSASEPAASEPSASEPSASGSAASGSAVSEPTAPEPGASEPVASGPAVSEPVASRLTASRLTASGPAALEPGAMESATLESVALEAVAPTGDAASQETSAPTAGAPSAESIAATSEVEGGAAGSTVPESGEPQAESAPEGGPNAGSSAWEGGEQGAGLSTQEGGAPAASGRVEVPKPFGPAAGQPKPAYRSASFEAAKPTAPAAHLPTDAKPQINRPADAAPQANRPVDARPPVARKPAASAPDLPVGQAGGRPAVPEERVPGPRSGEGRVRRIESVVGRDSGGWRRIAQVVVGGGGPRTDGSEIDEARARAVFGGSRRVVVLGCTGGAGQSTTALMLGHTLAKVRDDRIVAVDANTGANTLTSRIQPESPETLTSLLSGLDRVSGYLGMRGYTSRTPSGLEVIGADTDAGAEQRLADRTLFSDQRLGQAVHLFDRHYKLAVIDPAAALAARVLPYSDQLVLVVPASEEAAEAVAMTFEWLDGHGCADLRRRAVIVVNGVSRRSMADVEQAEAVARGRCRAIVRVPWEDELAPGGVDAVDPGQLRAAGRRAYLALAGVVVAGFAAQMVRASEEELASDPPGTRIGER
ncbi:TcpE family conjugal transfer membrane protein [Nonomuraea typhae]|uniref:TcpE family conjugal transfer membrane protein n=1 Tax=Nonomuraea typhae TaxID=2603600 RepID=A0ABW7YXB3_9ACTN